MAANFQRRQSVRGEEERKQLPSGASARPPRLTRAKRTETSGPGRRSQGKGSGLGVRTSASHSCSAIDSRGALGSLPPCSPITEGSDALYVPLTLKSKSLFGKENTLPYNDPWGPPTF